MPEPRSLGDFRSERPADEEFPLAGMHFSLDGQPFWFDGTDANILRISELAEMALTGGGGEENAAAMASMGLSLKTAMGNKCTRRGHPKGCPGEYRRLMAHVDEHRTPPSVITDIMQMINEAAQEVIEGATGRPTRRPSGSSAGRPGRDAQLSRLIASEKGDIAVEGEPQEQPPPPPPGLATLGAVTEDTRDPGMTEREEQAAARTVALMSQRRPAKRKGQGKARRTA